MKIRGESKQEFILPIRKYLCLTKKANIDIECDEN